VRFLFLNFLFGVPMGDVKVKQSLPFVIFLILNIIFFILFTTKFLQCDFVSSAGKFFLSLVIAFLFGNQKPGSENCKQPKTDSHRMTARIT
jgi:hypothetical protein